jgi:hypothetical protein
MGFINSSKQEFKEEKLRCGLYLLRHNPKHGH